MNKRRHWRRIVGLCVGTVFLTQNLYAQEMVMTSMGSPITIQDVIKNTAYPPTHNLNLDEDIRIADSFTRHGAGRYKKGDIEGAIQDFSRALLLDPYNQTARSSLIQLAKHKDVSAQQKVQLFLLEDLLENIRNLAKRVDYFQKKRDAFAQRLLDQGFPENRLIYEMETIKKTVLKDLKDWDSVTEVDSRANQDPLKVVNISLNFEKQQLSGKIAYLQRQYARLKNLRGEFKAATKKSSAAAAEKSDKAPLNVFAQTFYPQKDDLAMYTKAEAVKLEKEVAHVQGQINELRKQLKEKDQKIKDLTRELIDSSLKISEKDNLLKERQRMIDSLNMELRDIRARFELGQRIIAEKEEKLQTLQEILEKENNSLKAKTQKMADRVDDKDQSLRSIEKRLAESRRMLTDSKVVIKKQMGEIETLKEKLASLRRRFESSEKALFAKDEEIALLKKRLREEQARFKQDTAMLRKVVTTQEEGMKALLQERDAKITALSQELQGARQKTRKVKRLSQRILGRKGRRKELFSLKEELKKKEQHIALLKERRRKEVAELKKRLKTSEKKIARIQKLLEEKMRQAAAQPKKVPAGTPKERELSQALQEKTRQLEELKRALSASEERLVRAKRLIKGNVDKISLLHKQLNRLEGTVDKKDKVLSKKEQKIAKLKAKLQKRQRGGDQVTGTISKKDQEIAELHKMLEASKAEIGQAKELVKDKMSEIKRLTGRIMALQNQLAKYTGDKKDLKGVTEWIETSSPPADGERLKAQEAKLNEMADILQMYRLGLAEAYQTIREQDNHVAALKNEVDSLRSKVKQQEALVRHRERRIAVLKEKLIHNRETKLQRNKDLREIMKKQFRELKDATDKLNMYRHALAEANQRLDQKDQEVGRLNKEIVRLKTRLEQTNQLVHSRAAISPEELAMKNQRLEELEGILNIYRSKLSETKDDLKKKTADLNNLEDQIIFVQERLFKKNKILKQTKERLVELEKQLAEVQKHLSRLGKTSLRSKARRVEIKKEIVDLREKVKKLQESLKKQISAFDGMVAYLDQ